MSTGSPSAIAKIAPSGHKPQPQHRQRTNIMKHHYTTKPPSIMYGVLAIESAKLAPGTIAARSMQLGIAEGEPLALLFECLLRYASAHEKRYQTKLSQDYVMGPQFLSALVGVRNLLCGDGAVAMERGITTDSKDNGVLESMFWHCMSAAGYTEEDI